MTLSTYTLSHVREKCNKALLREVLGIEDTNGTIGILRYTGSNDRKNKTVTDTRGRENDPW